MASLDPRLNRIELPDSEQPYASAPELDHWQTFEVFHQARRGEQHSHVGIVHAPNPEMALVLAKEQFARRSQTANLWVVRTADVHATDYDDADMFLPSVDKSYREPTAYRTRDKIAAYKAAKGQVVDATEAPDDLSNHLPSPQKPIVATTTPAPGSQPNTEAAPKPRPRIIIAPKKKPQ